MELPDYALEYDERLDAVASLEILAELLPRTLSIPHLWKWVLLSLHSALQGFMVLALQGTNALAVLTEETARAWMEAYEADSLPTKRRRLDKFLALYEKIKSDAMLTLAHSKVFVPSPEQDANVVTLNSDRNSFVHYVPAQSLMDARVWTRITLDVVPIIEFLVLESNNVTFFESGQRDRVQGLCNLVKAEASALSQHYGA
jgi:hypothetical protein